jgi:hypothetical protein
VVERITVGTGVSDPTKERSIDLNNELQLLFVCSQGKCSYRKSVPQIIRSRREGIRCVCSRSIAYDPKTCVFSCPVVLVMWSLFSRNGFVDILAYGAGKNGV